jgi:hypothetical protein
VTKTIEHYSEKAQHYYDLYNSVDAESVHGDWKAFLQKAKAGTALDVGALAVVAMPTG